MPWKTSENGEGVFENGSPVWITETGEEKSVTDYGSTLKHISSLNKESAERKARIREQETILKLFDGIDDIPAFVEEARKNAESVQAMGDAQKASEQTVQSRISAAIAPKDKKISELEAEIKAVKGKWHSALIDAEFGLSRFVKDETVSPSMVKRLFAQHFSVDDEGRICATDESGKDIVEYDEAGNVSFDAILRKLVSASPFKENILVGSRASGSGSSSERYGAHGSKTMTRFEFDKLDSASKMKRIKEGYTITE